jgi:hypothetical protein
MVFLFNFSLREGSKIVKKVAIVTLIGYENYGNRLQNYATQEVIKNLGFEAKTLIYYKRVKPEKEPLHISLKRKILSFCNMTNKERYLAFQNKLTHLLYKNLIYKRNKAFKLFTEKNINETGIIYDDYVFNNLAEDYDFFLTGSDQVWHPFNKDKPLYFLIFAPKQKRIAYASSFGVTELPENCIETYKKYISEIPYLSVREQSGVEIIKKLTGRDAAVLVDPTMMLTKERWMSISKPAAYKPPKRYILVYFLGKISNEAKKAIKKIATRKDLDIVYIANFKDKKKYVADPVEFIYYINSADIVLTDSYHGTIFSILFEKPFVVFDRIHKGPSMITRIDTLLAKFNLESRRWKNMKDINMNVIFEMDFSHISSILEDERKKALNFLKKALNVESSTIKENEVND